MSHTDLKIRASLLYEFKRGAKATEAAERIRHAFGGECVSDRVAQQWFQRFRGGDEDLEEKPRSGRPLAFDDETLRNIIEVDSRKTCKDVARELNCDEATVRKRLHELGFTKKLDKWVPHRLTEGNKFTRLQICTSLLSRLEQEPFLDRILTCDEKWVIYENPRRSGAWLPKGANPATVPKADMHPKKLLLTVWWTARGIVHVDYLLPGQSITALVYSEHIDAVQQKLLQSSAALVNRKGVLLLHDNARPHTARQTREKLKQVGWEVLPHPPYSPDISPSDYHLFLAMSNFTRGKSYDNETALKDDIQRFFDSKDLAFYRHGIHSLVDRWRLVVDHNGDYFVE